jgi:uncharacterized protein YaaQ
MELSPFFKELSPFFKTFIVPLLGAGGGVALAGWVLKRLLGTWVDEGVKHGFETLRMEIKEEFEREKLVTTHNQKVIEEMVTELHGFTKRWYMPIINAIGNFAAHLRDRNDAYAFYSLACYVRSHNDMATQMHGYFLQDLVGERVIQVLAERFWYECIRAEGGGFLKEGEAGVLMDGLEEKMTADRFTEKVKKKNSTINKLYQRFGRWSKNETTRLHAVLMAETLEQVFRLEVNLPYKAWYGKVSSHVGKKNLSVIEREIRRLKGGELNKTEIDHYLKKIRQFMI